MLQCRQVRRLTVESDRFVETSEVREEGTVVRDDAESVDRVIDEERTESLHAARSPSSAQALADKKA